jgi:hypothetical protein
MIKPILFVVTLLACSLAGAQLPSIQVPEYQTFLLQYDSVQKELGISKAMALKMANVRAEARKTFMAVIQPATQSPTTQHHTPMAKVQAEVQKLDAKIVALLSTAQKARLKQIGLQYSGGFALADTRTAKALGISPEQQRKINMATLKAIRSMKSSETTTRGNGFKNRANPRTALQHMAAERKKMLADLDADAVKILTPAQVASWRKMQGKKFPIETLFMPPQITPHRT